VPNEGSPYMSLHMEMVLCVPITHYSLFAMYSRLHHSFFSFGSFTKTFLYPMCDLVYEHTLCALVSVPTLGLHSCVWPTTWKMNSALVNEYGKQTPVGFLSAQGNAQTSFLYFSITLMGKICLGTIEG